MMLRAATLLAGAVLMLAGRASAGGPPAVVVAGSDQTRILLPPGAAVEAYEGVGYRLILENGEARVHVEASPIASRAPYRAPARWSDDAVGRVARGRVSGAADEYEAASRILDWVARQIAYEHDRTMPQDALSTLARRSGYCTGIARLTVALLRAAGLEAREVAGYVVEGDEVRGYHRWVEVRFTDRGWVMSDPLRSHHFVPATYLRLASEQLTVSAGLEGLLLARSDRLVEVDFEPTAAPAVRLVRNHDRQRAAALRVELPLIIDGHATLVGETARRTIALRDGGATFLGLDGGDYQLRIDWSGGRLEQQVALLDRRRTSLHLHLPPRSRDAAFDSP